MSELHTHQLLTDDSGTETIEPEETIISDEKPHEIAEKTFADYNVRADIVESLADAGITHPFPIQAMTLPVALSGHDIIGQAKTGTGKTLGFGIPALQRVVGPDDAGFDKLPAPGAPQALVIVPDPRAGRPGRQRPAERRPQAQRPHHHDLRRPRLRAAGRGAAEGRRGRRRYSRPPHRPLQAEAPAS